MSRAYLSVVLIVLGGCPSQQSGPPLPGANAEGPAIATQAELVAATVAPDAALDIADFTSTTVCEKVVTTGSRLIRGEHCSAPDSRSWHQREYDDKKRDREI